MLVKGEKNILVLLNSAALFHKPGPGHCWESNCSMVTFSATHTEYSQGLIRGENVF